MTQGGLSTQMGFIGAKCIFLRLFLLPWRETNFKAPSTVVGMPTNLAGGAVTSDSVLSEPIFRLNSGTIPRVRGRGRGPRGRNVEEGCLWGAGSAGQVCRAHSQPRADRGLLGAGMGLAHPESHQEGGTVIPSYTRGNGGTGGLGACPRRASVRARGLTVLRWGCPLQAPQCSPGGPSPRPCLPAQRHFQARDGPATREGFLPPPLCLSTHADLWVLSWLCDLGQVA